MNMMMVNQAGRQQGSTAVVAAGKKLISIRALLEWAFQRECASLDFDEEGGMLPPSIGVEYLMITQGCRVDGGGRSYPHPDADLVASALAALPLPRGGRQMGVWMADLARIGGEPDWMPGAKPKCVPVSTKCNRHGWRAASEKVGSIHYQSRGQQREFEVRCCPVTYQPSADKIAAARRSYLGWWGALLELRETFRVYGGLTSYQVSDQMPQRTPWKITA